MIEKSIIKKIANECIYDAIYNAYEGCFGLSALEIKEEYGFSLEEIIDSFEEIECEIYCNEYGVDVIDTTIYQYNDDYIIDGTIGLFWSYNTSIDDEIMFDEDVYILEYCNEDKEIRFEIPKSAVPDTERDILDHIIEKIISSSDTYIYGIQLHKFCENNGEWIYKNAKEKGLILDEVTFDLRKVNW